MINASPSLACRLVKVCPYTFLFFALLLLMTAGCSPSNYLSTPNNTQKAKVILYLTDSSKIPGQITVAFERYYSAAMVLPNYLEFIPEGQVASERIDLKNILGYSYGPDYFALKRVDIYMTNVYHLLFVKRLTPEKSKIQLYELHESGYGSPTGEASYSYYLSFPKFSPLTTINAHSSDIVPNFDLKVSKMVDDCPALADKIRNKEKGYFLPAVTFDIRRPGEVLLKVIDEYNQCQ
jgi:hypothetical protein